MTGGRILVIDDDPSLRVYAQQFLGRRGFLVESCATPQQAWESLREAEGGFLLVVVDLSLLDGEGLDFGRQLQQSYPALPLLYWSGLPADREVLKKEHPGPVDFLAKPFSPRQLVEKVEQLVGPGRFAERLL
jgi:two-component system OmpR family response regulator